MQIQSVNQNYSKAQHNPNFGAWSREVTKQISKTETLVSHRNDTSFFRDNDFWKDVVDYICTKSKNKNKINVYFYGCSNGSEPYTFVMQLVSSADNAMLKKVNQIVAKDYDKDAIAMAKSGILPVQDYEFFKIQKYTNGHFKDFFENGEPKFKEKENLQIPLKKKFLDKINFSIADVTLDYEKIEPENSLVSIRNFLPYLGSRSNVIELIKNLGEHLKSGSNVMVGNFDHKGLSEHRINLKELLEIAGFRSTKVENLYEKI